MEKRKRQKRKSQGRGSQQKEDQGARKGRTVAAHCVSRMLCGSGGSKSRPADGADTGASSQMSDQKLHAGVARSTLQSQNGETTSASERLWKLSRSKSAVGSGAKHI